MTPKFTQAFQSRLEELVADLRYFHKPTDKRIAPRVYKTMLPDIAKFVVGQESNDADYSPAVCWGIDGGEVARIDKHPIDVSLIGAIAVDQSVGSSLDQIQSGSADIEELAVALKGLIKDCYYEGFRLVRPVRFTIGLPGVEGDRQQPHPVYVLRYIMSFIAT
jgi:hypothetical protein